MILSRATLPLMSLPCHVIRSGLLAGHVSEEIRLQSRLFQDRQMVAVPVGTCSTPDSQNQKLALGDRKMGYKIGGEILKTRISVTAFFLDVRLP